MKENRELHYRYAVSYCLIAVVLLVALAYYDVPNLVDKFSFALTLSSLLLAVLAIFFTIISAQKQDLQLAKLVETNTNIGNAAGEIRSAAQDIRLFAQEAPQHFQTLGLKIDTLTTNYDTIKSSHKQQEPVEKNLKPTMQIDSTQFQKMFGHLQFSAMAVLYLFVKSYEKDLVIEAETLTKVGILSFDYAAGVLNGLETTGLISYKFYKMAIVPVSCADVVKNEIHDLMISVIKIVEEENANRLRNYMSAIESHVD